MRRRAQIVRPDRRRNHYPLPVLGVDLVETGFETAEIDGIMLLNDEEDLAAGEAPAPLRLETAIWRLTDVWATTASRTATPATPPFTTG
jgi:hypothetical protein